MRVIHRPPACETACDPPAPVPAWPHPLPHVLQAGRHLLWLLLTVPSRVRGRNRSSTWSAPLQAISVYNKALQASGLLHPQGPMLLLDLHALSEGASWASF